MLRKLVEAVECTRLKGMNKREEANVQVSGLECGILDKATDWKVYADLPNMRTYLDIIKRSNPGLDIILVPEKPFDNSADWFDTVRHLS